MVQREIYGLSQNERAYDHIATKVARESLPYVGEASHSIPEQLVGVSKGDKKAW
ncbi:hypothetical protein F383_20602 [Gossypium arboreum]|uniref:Uncharacterized protein n=1 Tax=Gossypium arboreum TaxID=29729 RepID=A0A0B0NYH6_GOSAR|nr:hypothetical protein F383_20602 [Gossypium arboreum]